MNKLYRTRSKMIDFKTLKTKEKSQQLSNKELEAVAEEELNDLAKKILLRNKFTKWVRITASIVGIFVSMTMPVRAEIERQGCEGDHDTDDIVIVQAHDESEEDGGDGIDGNGERKCFEGDGEKDVLIHNVESIYSRENTGSVDTNKGTFQFWENEQINFNAEAGSTVVITGISLD